MTLGLRGLVAAVFAGTAVLVALVVSVYVGWFVLVDRVHDDAKATAFAEIERSANMFMVSTRKYLDESNAATTPAAKEAVRTDWIRTIKAVDDAVVHDFGAGKLRVRLVNDPAITGAPQFGGDVTSVQTAFEREALRAFAGGRATPVVTEEGGALRVAVPLPSNAHPGCAACHQVPADKPQLLGTLNAYVPLTAALEASRHQAMLTGAVVLLLTGLVLAGIYLLFARHVVAPVERVGAAVRALVDGRTDVTLNESRGDEIGEIARAVNVFGGKLEAMRRMEGQQEQMRRDAEEEKRRSRVQLADEFESRLRRSVEGLTATIGRMRDECRALAGSADGARQKLQGMSSTAGLAAGNVQTVAAAADELAASVNEISRQINESSRISETAVNQAEETNATVAGLADAAQKIGEVVNLINNIASQTNLLALNATIEAARAGEAGKGFAVVASEVKNLANQTAKATEEISSQIEAMQQVTGTAVDAIRGIGSTIGQMSSITTTVAAAVEEQHAATREIARNVQEAAGRTRDVSAGVEEVAANAAQTSSIANATAGNAADAAQEADALHRDMDEFITKVRTQ
ncbi:MAG TPA: methyl-accepting chemotaxis protein [Azospirillum sp.]